ncbi:MAG TPA: hypothetical protein VN753_15255 [Terracidiphilus sp.]|nr:hypothetical protein [Terracidiphilus sp.]
MAEIAFAFNYDEGREIDCKAPAGHSPAGFLAAPDIIKLLNRRLVWNIVFDIVALAPSSDGSTGSKVASQSFDGITSCVEDAIISVLTIA